MSVRPAIPADIGRIVYMVERFNAIYFDVPVSPVKTRNMVEWVIDEGVIFVSDSGFIAGMVTEDLFRDWTILQEFGWFAEDRSGIALLDAFIHAGHSLEVDEVRISTLSTSSPLAGRILQRKGFAPLEHSYRLKLGG